MAYHPTLPYKSHARQPGDPSWGEIMYGPENQHQRQHGARIQAAGSLARCTATARRQARTTINA